MKVLVTGGAGYIGVVLCERLLEAGHEVRVLDRLYWGSKPIEHIVDRMELIHADVRDFDERTLDGVDGVVHLAGLSNDPTAEYNPTANWEMNAVATETLAAACKRRGVGRLTFGSSASIYDGLGDGLFDETTKVSPRGAYSRSKFEAEQHLMRAADGRFAPIILRQGTVYGYSPRMRLDLVVNTFIKDALLRERLYLHGGGWMWRPLVDVTDVAEAHIRCLEAPASTVGGQIFNVVHENHQIRQLAMLVAGSLSLHHRHVRLENAPVPSINRNYRCANRKLQDAIGFTPRVTVLESIERILSFLPIDDPIGLAHPRYYNIAWMTLIDEVIGTHGAFADVWSSQRRDLGADSTTVRSQIP